MARDLGPTVEVTPQELEAALQHIRAGNPPSLRIATVSELLKAVELGIIEKSEARSLLGFTGKSRSAAARQRPRTGGRFTSGK